MIEISMDMWEWFTNDRLLVIPTNIGWKSDGSNPMGVGVAAKAARLVPELPIWYGNRCKKYREKTAVCIHRPSKLILFPTKPLNIAKPWLSWQSNASMELVLFSTIQLQKLGEILAEKNSNIEIGLPLVGCGAGSLSPDKVIHILSNRLDNHFTLFT